MGIKFCEWRKIQSGIWKDHTNMQYFHTEIHHPFLGDKRTGFNEHIQELSRLEIKSMGRKQGGKRAAMVSQNFSVHVKYLLASSSWCTVKLLLHNSIFYCFVHICVSNVAKERRQKVLRQSRRVKMIEMLIQLSTVHVIHCFRPGPSEPAVQQCLLLLTRSQDPSEIVQKLVFNFLKKKLLGEFSKC